MTIIICCWTIRRASSDLKGPHAVLDHGWYWLPASPLAVLRAAPNFLCLPRTVGVHEVDDQLSIAFGLVGPVGEAEARLAMVPVAEWQADEASFVADLVVGVGHRKTHEVSACIERWHNITRFNSHNSFDSENDLIVLKSMKTVYW